MIERVKEVTVYVLFFSYPLSVSDLVRKRVLHVLRLVRSNRRSSSVSLGMSVESIPLLPLSPPHSPLLGQRERVGGDRHVGELSFPIESREKQISGLRGRRKV